MELKIEPAYYQTWWFRLLCAAAVLIFMRAAHAYRLRRAEANIRQRLAARLSERERIARELHDTFLQTIQGLMFKLEALAILSDGAVRKRFEGVLEQLDDAISEGRARVLGLRGADQPPAEPADHLNSYGNNFLQMSSAAFKTRVVGQPRVLNPVAADEVLIIGREAIGNCFTHAEARHIEVELVYAEKSFALRVRDDGKGMEAATAKSGRAGHWGIVGMRERARALGATLSIRSRHGTGTEIELTVRAATAYAVSSAARNAELIWRLIDVLGGPKSWAMGLKNRSGR
jgi:signal transduction histidine kinase